MNSPSASTGDKMSRYLTLLALASAVNAGPGVSSLAGIKHVVVLMKENRAFDHVSIPSPQSCREVAHNRGAANRT